MYCCRVRVQVTFPIVGLDMREFIASPTAAEGEWIYDLYAVSVRVVCYTPHGVVAGASRLGHYA